MWLKKLTHRKYFQFLSASRFCRDELISEDFEPKRRVVFFSTPISRPDELLSVHQFPPDYHLSYLDDPSSHTISQFHFFIKISLPYVLILKSHHYSSIKNFNPYFQPTYSSTNNQTRPKQSIHITLLDSPCYQHFLHSNFPPI